MSAQIEMEIMNEYGAQSLLLKMGDDSVLLEPAEIDVLIEELGNRRSDMKPYTSAQMARDRQYVVETSPVWQTVRNPLFDGLVVFFRHSGFGWTGFAIPNGSLRKLLESMGAVSASPPTEIVAERGSPFTA
jgi:hypothetical protein